MPKFLSTVSLRRTKPADLETLFRFQLDREANYLAAFTSKDPMDLSAYIQKHIRLLTDPTVNNQTVLLGSTIVGSIDKFVMESEAEITCWIDKTYWAKALPPRH